MNGPDAMLEGSVASEEDIRCPGCGHLNPSGLARCERCTGPLTGPVAYDYVSPWPQQPVRPTGDTILAWLLIISGCLFWPAACYGTLRALSTADYVYVPAVLAFLALLAIPLAIIPWVLGAGLWHQKRWARQVVVGLLFFGASVAGYIFLKALTSPSEGRGLTLAGSAVVLVAGGFTVRWLVNSGKYFE